MTRGEKARTKSAYYLAAGDFQRAIPELRECVSIHPSAHGAKDNLALAHLYARNVKLALSTARANYAASPAFLAGANLAMYLMYAGEYEESLYLIRSLQGGRGAFALNTTIAIGQLMLGKSEDAKTVYESMILGVDSLRAAGALGLADLYAYLGDYRNAFRTLCANPPEASDPLRNTHLAYKGMYAAESRSALVNELADVRNAIDSALVGNGTFIELFLVGRAAIALNCQKDAADISAILRNKGNVTASVYATLLDCESRLSDDADVGPTVQSLTDANATLDTWHGHYLLASSYHRLGSMLDAHAELDTCLSRSGEGVAYMLDEIPTTHLFAQVKKQQEESQASL